jgi:hypothetical protein
MLTTVIRRTCLDQAGWFDESLVGPEDYDYWLRLSKLWKFDYIDKPLASYRSSQNFVSRNKRRMLNNVINIKNREFAQSSDLKNLGFQLLDPSYYSLFTKYAKECLYDNDLVDARAFIKEYRLRRGTTPRYWVNYFASFLPFWLIRRIIRVWDDLHGPAF